MSNYERNSFQNQDEWWQSLMEMIYNGRQFKSFMNNVEIWQTYFTNFVMWTLQHLWSMFDYFSTLCMERFMKDIKWKYLETYSKFVAGFWRRTDVLDKVEFEKIWYINILTVTVKQVIHGCTWRSVMKSPLFYFL